jgi:hypothetical protein
MVSRSARSPSARVTKPTSGTSTQQVFDSATVPGLLGLHCVDGLFDKPGYGKESFNNAFKGGSTCWRPALTTVSVANRFNIGDITSIRITFLADFRRP